MHSTHRPAPADTRTDESTTPARVLRDAATYLDRYGWTQHTLYAYLDQAATFPAACARGAIHIAVCGAAVQPGDERLDDEQLGLIDETELLLGEWLESGSLLAPVVIQIWNDDLCRTALDVVDALREVADTIEPPTSGGAA